MCCIKCYSLSCTRHMTVVPRTQFTSGLEHDQLVDFDFVEIPGWFEGRLYR